MWSDGEETCFPGWGGPRRQAGWRIGSMLVWLVLRVPVGLALGGHAG